MYAPQPEFNGEERDRGVLHSEPTKPLVHEYEPKFKHTQEDLKYMFGIDVLHEEDLYTEVIKKKMYDKAVTDFKLNNPFTLEYFFEENLLSPMDMKDEDRAELKRKAFDLLYSMRHIVRRTRSRDLFIQAGILTEEEADKAILTIE
jgi:hypothetical protein